MPAENKEKKEVTNKDLNINALCKEEAKQMHSAYTPLIQGAQEQIEHQAIEN